MKRRHTCGDSLCFHGAFATKAAAERKKARLKGARVQFKNLGRRSGWRYIVTTEKRKT